MVTLADGSIVVGGAAMDASGAPAFGLERYTRGGRLDGTWGAAGRVVLQLGAAGGSRVQALLAEPDGGVVAAGTSSNGGIATVRLDAAGRVVWAGAPRPVDGTGRSIAWMRTGAIARAKDGGLIVAGAGDDAFTDLAVVRLNPVDGSLDQSFGADGYAVDRGRDDCGLIGFLRITGVVALPGGRIAVGGYRQVCGPSANSSPSAKLSVFDAGGALIASRHGAELGIRLNLMGLAAGPGGTLVAVGDHVDGATMARYREDGSLDPSFGDAGAALLARNALVTSGLAVQPDGDRLLGVVPFEAEPAVVRRRSDGKPDRAFSSTGLRGSGIFPTALALQPGGGIVVAGARRDTEGNLDTSVLLSRLHGGTLGRVIVRHVTTRHPRALDVRLTCRRPATVRCTGTVRAVIRGRRAGSRRYAAAPGRTTTVHVQLRRRVRVKHVRIVVSNGPAPTVRVRVPLQP
jgi:uncharacterized delta-60 repeat protein